MTATGCFVATSVSLSANSLPCAACAPRMRNIDAFVNDPRADAYETLVERYARMAHTFEPRPVDRILRVLDIVLAVVGLIVTSPLMALCALAVRLSGSRGVLYRGADFSIENWL